MHIKREKASLPAELRRSKTPLLKLPILCAVIDLSFLKVKRPSVDSTVDVTSATVHRTQKHRIQRITLVLSLFIYRVT